MTAWVNVTASVRGDHGARRWDGGIPRGGLPNADNLTSRLPRECLPPVRRYWPPSRGRGPTLLRQPYTLRTLPPGLCPSVTAVGP